MRRFVADASHELRTPLTTLQGYAALHTGRVGARVRWRQGGRAGNGARVEAGRSRPELTTRCAGSATRRPGCDGSSTACSTWRGSTTSGSSRASPVDLGVLVRDVASDLRVVAPDRVVTVEAPDVASSSPVTATGSPRRSWGSRRTPCGTPRPAPRSGYGWSSSPTRCGSTSPTRAPASRPSTCRTSSSASTGSTGAVLDQRWHGAGAGHRRRHRPGPRWVGARDVARSAAGSTFSVTLPA